MSRQSELEVAMSRLETKISVMEMQLNSTTQGANRWPSRDAWRGLLRMSQQAVDEYYKEKENGPKEINHVRKTSTGGRQISATGQPD